MNRKIFIEKQPKHFLRHRYEISIINFTSHYITLINLE